MFSLSHLIREAERTLAQRRETYPRLVAEDRMTDRTAELRLDQMEAICDVLAVLILRLPDAAVEIERALAERQAQRELTRRTGVRG